MESMATPCPVGDGGNTTIINQDEQLILLKTFAAIEVRSGVEPLWQEDDSHIQGIYAQETSDVGGS